MIHFPNIKADIEVMIKNNRPNKDNLYTGYRPAFKVKEDYLTTGLIRLIDCDELSYGEENIAEVWFITPEQYPNCLEVGQTIYFQDGAKVQGFVTITKINNKILEK
jgi:elongation factor Tu